MKRVLLFVAGCVFIGLATSVLSAKQKPEEQLMKNFELIHKPSMLMIGIECRTSNDSNAAPHDIPRLWEKFYSEGMQSLIPNKASEEVIALYCDYEGDHTKPYTCLIGCPVRSLDQIPVGMVGKEIPASTFAVFHPAGEFPKSLIETWGAIWHSDLKRTYTGDYELYGPKFASPSQEVDVLIAVEGE